MARVYPSRGQDDWQSHWKLVFLLLGWWRYYANSARRISIQVDCLSTVLWSLDQPQGRFCLQETLWLEAKRRAPCLCGVVICRCHLARAGTQWICRLSKYGKDCSTHGANWISLHPLHERPGPKWRSIWTSLQAIRVPMVLVLGIPDCHLVSSSVRVGSVQDSKPEEGATIVNLIVTRKICDTTTLPSTEQ